MATAKPEIAMAHADHHPSSLPSARPDVTSDLMERTGLDEACLTRLVRHFYERVRADPMLGPIFSKRIDNWTPHLERMVAFWSSVALMTGRYHGRPVPKHVALPVTWDHYERWLALFRQTARETCPPAGVDHVIERAERIAQSLHMAGEFARRGSASTLLPRQPADPAKLATSRIRVPHEGIDR